MIKIQSFIFNSFQENTYILFDDTKECIIVDPGCYEKYEQKLLLDFVVKNKLNPVKLINTHCHVDHVLGNHFVAEKWKLELAMHELDVPTLKSVKDYCTVYGFHNYQESPLPSHFLNEGEKVKFGESELDILFKRSSWSFIELDNNLDFSRNLARRASVSFVIDIAILL